ncbi:UNVERIFIED_ORG: hypothetical protein J2W66_000332 [Agrobacterium larrymoorei]|uniref:DUF4145 domain-containing protein n=1 Tax=Rhizobium rhizogenes TaxID=359 RepID=A0AA92H959_RHIRH|nr:DUF4145 domain-containing protein [Rhizobium rhizogenes]MDP9569872.1 hypothetical protein [Agrobacterium larrymoorei]PVE54045.1 hypothetical protein DC430_12440 [Rhizobium rhizogenes]PVE66537.1 hypothetical protein DC415_09055 [Agrobacterium tumefaciens]PVE76525.1 hypothetical protein DCP16_09055 [Sphingomonas sp. TPD3009]
MEGGELQLMSERREARWRAFVEAINQEANSGTDRGLVLVCVSMIDAALGELLEAFLIDHKDARDLLNGANRPLKGLSNRINMAFALGLIRTVDRTALHMLRDIRNEAAHEIAFNLSETKHLARLLAAYKETSILEPNSDLRERLIRVAIWLLSGLDLAAQFAEKERRTVPELY